MSETSPTIPVAGSDPQSFSSLQPQEAVVPVAAEGQVSGLREVEWVREDRDDGRGTLIYSLRNDGYRRGKAVRVNDVTVNIERSPASDTDVQEVIAQVMSALTGNASANTVGMSEANEPSPSNPPPESKVASQREDDLTPKERAMIDAAWEVHKAAGPCDRPPSGWKCSREYGHEGPCAASAASDTVEAVAWRIVNKATGITQLADRPLSDLPFNRERFTVQPLYASPTEQASDVSGLVEALEKIKALRYEPKGTPDGFDRGARAAHLEAFLIANAALEALKQQVKND